MAFPEIPTNTSSDLWIIPDRQFVPTSPSSPHSVSLTSRTSTTTSRESAMADEHGAGADPPGEQVEALDLLSMTLKPMEILVKHMRKHGASRTANNISRTMVEVLNHWHNSTETWPSHVIIPSEAAPANIPNGTTPNGTVPDTNTVSETLIDISTDAAVGNSNGAAQGVMVNTPSTYAAIAAAMPAANNSIVNISTLATVQLPLVAAQSSTGTVVPEKRVVWIINWPERKPLSEATKQIGQGSVYSMAFSQQNNALCIIFHHAQSALALCEHDERYVEIHGASCFGGNCFAVMGPDPYDDDDIGRMSPPYNERRRLTFARSQLFSNGLTEAAFKAEIHRIVGKSEVELVWLFNNGNATVVLSGVLLARLVRDTFLSMASHEESLYHNVQVTFSHDPCERPIALVRQLPAGRDHRAGTYGGASDIPAGVAVRAASSQRRNGHGRESGHGHGRSRGRGRDSEGWQTVARRR